MSDAKHTPGPWSYREVSGLRPFEVFEEDGNDDYGPGIENAPIAEITDYIDDPDVIEANARLIAAAPDLLEALKAVMAEWRDGYGLNCVEQCRAAIAKASSA